MVAAAGELFAADGYARTTLAKIAAAAGVSAETVQSHGPKAALMIAAIEYAATGVIGEENVLNLEIAHTLLAIDDPERARDTLVDIQADIHAKTAQLSLALAGGAGVDPDLDRYRTELIASVTLQGRRILEAFSDRGWLRRDLPFDEVVQTAAVLCSVETYLRVTLYDGWSTDAYVRWLRRLLTESVFAR